MLLDFNRAPIQMSHSVVIEINVNYLMKIRTKLILTVNS